MYMLWVNKNYCHKFIAMETEIKHGKLYKDKRSTCFIVQQSIWYPLINVGKKHSHKRCSSWHEYNVSPHYKIVKFGENFKNIPLECTFFNYTCDYLFVNEVPRDLDIHQLRVGFTYMYVYMYVYLCVYGWSVCLCFSHALFKSFL
jgi:hypothetical protein